jgi:hypothetical protein
MSAGVGGGSAMDLRGGVLALVDVSDAECSAQSIGDSSTFPPHVLDWEKGEVKKMGDEEAMSVERRVEINSGFTQTTANSALLMSAKLVINLTYSERCVAISNLYIYPVTTSLMTT